MFTVFDPLIDFRCPRCQRSLRFRRLQERAAAPLVELGWPCACPYCHSAIVQRRHPALANNWLWSRFTLPGIVLCGLGALVPSLAWLLPLAAVAMGLGLLALLVYMVRARWGWPRYVPDDANAP